MISSIAAEEAFDKIQLPFMKKAKRKKRRRRRRREEQSALAPAASIVSQSRTHSCRAAPDND